MPSSKSDIVSIREIPAADLEAVLRLHNQFTAQDRSLATFESHYDETPSLFRGAYEEDTLIGVCVGWPSTAEQVEIVGIGVTSARRRSGIGSRLVEVFEENAADRGFSSISVASAGGYVDRFYSKLGYAPSRILVRGDPSDFPNDHHELDFDIVEERWEEDTFKLYIDVDEVDHDLLSSVRKTFDDEEAIYIMQKIDVER